MTDDSDTNDEIALAAEYALGLLTPGEVLAFDDVMSVDPDMRAQYAAWAESFVSMTDDIAPVVPPVGLETRIRAQLFGAADKKRSIMARLGLMGPLFAGLVAAGVVLVVLSQTSFLKQAGPVYVAEIAAADASMIVQARFDAAKGALHMTREAGTPLAGRSQELWLIVGENAPISLGIWPAGQAEATLAVPQELRDQMAGNVLAISDEPFGGSLTGGPTGAVLGVGSVTLLDT